MFCPTCGATAVPGQKFCMHCGTSLALVAEQPPAQYASPAPPPPPGSFVDPTVPQAPRPAVRRVDPGTGQQHSQQYPAQQYGTPTGVVEQTPYTTPVPTYATTPIWPPVPSTEQWPTAEQPSLSAEPFDVGPLVSGSVIAAGLGIAASLLRLGSTKFGFLDTHFSIGDLASNAIAAMIVTAIVLVGGAVLAATGRRIGAGLAGGAGLAMAGLAAINTGLAKAQLDALSAGTVGDGTLTITYEVGFYLMIAAGAIGFIVFLVSISAAGDDHRPKLNPLIGVLGVLGTLAVVVGPLIPLHGASFSDNVSTDGGVAVLVYVRLGALAAILIGGVVGFVTNRRWGSAVVLGTVAAAVVQWITTLSAGDDLTGRRIGVGIRNPGALNAEPHIAVTIGLVVMLVAAIAGLIIGSATSSDAQVVT